jgi:hypothetical protein
MQGSSAPSCLRLSQSPRSASLAPPASIPEVQWEACPVPKSWEIINSIRPTVPNPYLIICTWSLISHKKSKTWGIPASHVWLPMVGSATLRRELDMHAYVVLSLRPLDHSLDTLKPFNLRPNASQCIPVPVPHRPGNYNRGALLVPHKGVGNDVVTITSGQERHWILGASCHYVSFSSTRFWQVDGLWFWGCQIKFLVLRSQNVGRDVQQSFMI